MTLGTAAPDDIFTDVQRWGDVDDWNRAALTSDLEIEARDFDLNAVVADFSVLTAECRANPNDDRNISFGYGVHFLPWGPTRPERTPRIVRSHRPRDRVDRAGWHGRDRQDHLCRRAYDPPHPLRTLHPVLTCGSPPLIEKSTSP